MRGERGRSSCELSMRSERGKHEGQAREASTRGEHEGRARGASTGGDQRRACEVILKFIWKLCRSLFISTRCPEPTPRSSAPCLRNYLGGFRCPPVCPGRHPTVGMAPVRSCPSGRLTHGRSCRTMWPETETVSIGLRPTFSLAVKRTISSTER